MCKEKKKKETRGAVIHVSVGFGRLVVEALTPVLRAEERLETRMTGEEHGF